MQNVQIYSVTMQAERAQSTGGSWLALADMFGCKGEDYF